MGLLLFPLPLVLQVLEPLGHLLLEVDALLGHQLLVGEVPVDGSFLGLTLGRRGPGVELSKLASWKNAAALNFRSQIHL